jgi:hypothetical protein
MNLPTSTGRLAELHQQELRHAAGRRAQVQQARQRQVTAPTIAPESRLAPLAALTRSTRVLLTSLATVAFGIQLQN